MKWVVSMFLLALTASCSNYADEVDAISTDVELLNDELDRIGERSIPNYRWSGIKYARPFQSKTTGDSITLSAEEFNDIQTELYLIRRRLDKLANKMTETEE